MESKPSDLARIMESKPSDLARIMESKPSDLARILWSPNLQIWLLLAHHLANKHYECKKCL